MYKINKGFTLIELLVVIAIIGILSSVVLASLNNARTKTSDAVVKSQMSSLRTQAGMWYEDNGSVYNTSGVATNTCDAANTIFADTKMADFIAKIVLQSDPTSVMSCYTTDIGDKWAVGVSLLKGGGTWCVDSSGYSSPGTASDTGICS